MELPLHYISGEDVHVGDRVQYNNVYATVVFVSNGETEEYADGYADYMGSDRGVMLCDDDGNLTNLSDADERVTFLDRAYAPGEA